MNCTTEYTRVDGLQLSLQKIAELTDCRWTDIVQGRAAKEAKPSGCRRAEDSSGAERCAPELTVLS